MINVDNAECLVGECGKPSTMRLRSEMNLPAVPPLTGPFVMWFCDSHGEILLASEAWELIEERGPGEA